MTLLATSCSLNCLLVKSPVVWGVWAAMVVLMRRGDGVLGCCLICRLLCLRCVARDAAAVGVRLQTLQLHFFAGCCDGLGARLRADKQVYVLPSHDLAG